MKRVIAVTAIFTALLVATMPADAASPASGTLSKTKRTLTWQGATYTYAIPWPDSSLFCLDNQCDHFKLKVNMGDGARIKVAIQMSSSGVEGLQNAGGVGVAPNDYDLYVYDPNGIQIGESATETGNEKITFTHKAKFRNKAYDVMVSPWLVVPGATYKGMITTVKFVK